MRELTFHEINEVSGSNAAPLALGCIAIIGLMTIIALSPADAVPILGGVLCVTSMVALVCGK